MGRGIPGEPSTRSVAYAVASFMSASQCQKIDEGITGIVDVSGGKLMGIALFQGLEDEVLPVLPVHCGGQVRADTDRARIGGFGRVQPHFKSQRFPGEPSTRIQWKGDQNVQNN